MKLSEEEIKYNNKAWCEIKSLLSKYINLTDIQREALRKQVLSEVDELIIAARELGKSPFAIEQERIVSANNKIQQRREIELNGHTVSFENFKNKFQEIIKNTRFFPDTSSKTLSGAPVLEAIYRASSPDYRESYGAKNELIGVCDPQAVKGFIRALRRNYEILRKSEILNNSEVKAISNHSLCSNCKKLDGQYLPVNLLLKTYDVGIPSFPHELPYEDEIRWCPGPTLMIASDEIFNLR